MDGSMELNAVSIGGPTYQEICMSMELGGTKGRNVSRFDFVGGDLHVFTDFR